MQCGEKWKVSEKKDLLVIKPWEIILILAYNAVNNWGIRADQERREKWGEKEEGDKEKWRKGEKEKEREPSQRYSLS